ncbi:MAG: GTP cyclohydrolase I FolE [bacterium]|nr:GTP cyclohydrolase I FolE [bacterium]
MDPEKIKEGVRLVLEGIGDDFQPDRLLDTPRRVAEMYMDVLSGTHKDPDSYLKSLAEEKHEEMVILKDIPIYSMCEHHMLPFSGIASIAYIPSKGRIMGLNTIAELVDLLSKRLQIQERLTKQIADYLIKAMNPLGVMVVIKAQHLCMIMRGAKKPGSTTVTSAVRGIFREKDATRAEAMSLLMAKE